MKNFNDDLFRQAIFKTIRLWCTSEYQYSKDFKDAFTDWNEHKKYDLSDYSKNYRKFLHDYSIDRTRKHTTLNFKTNIVENTDERIINDFFNLITISEGFEPKMVDDLAKKFKDNGYTTKKTSSDKDYVATLPISLVSKTFFLYYPETVALFDSRVTWAITSILERKKTIGNYQEYFILFEKLKKDYKDLGLEVIFNYLPTIKNTIENFYTAQYKALNNILDDTFMPFDIMNKPEWLFHRSLDKYLWIIPQNKALLQ